MILSQESLPIELDDEENPLSFYSVYDGCEIIANEVCKLHTPENKFHIEKKITEQEQKGDMLRKAMQKQMSVS